MCGPRPFYPCVRGNGETERVLQRRCNIRAKVEHELHRRGGAWALTATTRWSSAVCRNGDPWLRATAATWSTFYTNDKTKLCASCINLNKLEARPAQGDRPRRLKFCDSSRSAPSHPCRLVFVHISVAGCCVYTVASRTSRTVFPIKKRPPCGALSRFYRSPPTSPFSSPHLQLALRVSSSSSECSLRQASPASTHPPSVPGVGRGGTIACWALAASSGPSLVRVSSASAAVEVLPGRVPSRPVVPAIAEDWCSVLVLPSAGAATVLSSSTGTFSPRSVVSVKLILTVNPSSL